MSRTFTDNQSAIVIKSLDGRITSWDNSAEQMFGYTAAEAIGKHISIIIPFDYQDEEYEILDRLKDSETAEAIETVRRCREGSLLRVRMTASPIFNEERKLVGLQNVFEYLSMETIAKHRAEA